MRGRLKEKSDFWKKITVNGLVRSWIMLGFTLMWLKTTGPPTPVFFYNHSSALEHASFVDGAIEELLATGAARAVEHQPRCVLPLGVVPKKGSSKYRLIFDARYINSHLHVPSFKYESLSSLTEVLKPNDYMFTIDLKSGYHHIDMHEDTWEFLGFQWKGCFYQFVQLPFGLAPACWVFTTVTRELQKYWRADGHRCSCYIDDSLHAHQDMGVLLQWQQRVLGDLANAGFLVSDSKCSLEPEQRKAYLGAEVDTVRGALFVPEGKRLAIQASIAGAAATFQRNGRFRVRDLASIAGSLQSMSHSFGKISVLMTRRMCGWIALQLRDGYSYNHLRPLTPEVAGELDFWSQSFVVYDGSKPIWRPSHLHTLVIHTDAAGRSEFAFGGWGGWTKENGQLLIASGKWDFETKARSSTWLELLGMLNVLQSLNMGGRLIGQRVLIRTDSQPARDILVKGGSVVPAIQDVCMPLLWFCIEQGIDLLLEWVPRELNEFADALSKHQDYGGWVLNPARFAELATLWGSDGRFTVDLFASATDHQMVPYYSYHYTPTCAGVNAFAHEWPMAPEVAWCNPPFAIIGRVLAHAAACRARLCLVAPFWPRAVWWPRLIAGRTLFNKFVHAVHVFGRSTDLFNLDGGMPVHGGLPPKWNTMALLMDFGADAPQHIPVPPL